MADPSHTPSSAALAVPDPPVSGLRRLHIIIVALAAGLFLGHAGLQYFNVLEQKRDITRHSLEDAQTLLLTLDEHLARTLHAGDPLLVLAGSQVETALRRGNFDRATLHEAFSRIHSGAPQFSLVSFVDREGLVSFTSLAANIARVDVGDRDYFRAHRDDPSSDVRIGEPIMGRVGGRIVVPLSRRVNGPDGEFAGVVVGSLAADYLSNFYSRLQQQVTTLSILSESGTMLVRIPDEGLGAGNSLAHVPVFTTYRQDDEGWFWRHTDELGPPRHIVFRKASGLPFVLTISIADDLLLEPWWQEVYKRVVESFWVALALVVFTVLLLRASYAQEGLARGLAESEARYRDLVDASSDWHWETGPDQRFTVVRDRRRSESTVPYGDVTGRTRAELIDVAGTPTLQQHLDDLAERRPFRDFTYRRVLENGQVRYTKSSGKPLFNAEGEFLGYRGTAADVTETVMAEERASSARRLLANAIETLHEGFVLFDSQDRFVLCNRKFRELYVESADLLTPGGHYETLLRKAVERGQFPEAGSDPQKWIENALAEHHVKASTRQRLLPGDRWVEVREVKIEDGGSVGIHIDITEAKRAEEKLRESEARLRSIAANMSGAVLECTLGEDNLIRHLYVSDRIEDITGYTPQELIDDPDLTRRIMGEVPYAQSVERLRDASRSLTSLEREFLINHRDGSRRWARSSSRPRRGPGGVVLWNALLLDITGQKAAEAERRELESQLRHLQRIEAVGTLASGMAHEINNKLVPIVTFSELMLMNTPEGSSGRKPLQKIHDAASRIRDLVSRVLAMSRSETAGGEVIELKTVAAGAVDLLRATLRRNVRLSLDASTGGRVLGDTSQLEQVLVNLCTNAAHAIGTNQGEVRIELDETEIPDGATPASAGLPRGPYIRLRVSDNGCGMSLQTLQRIFEPFYTTKEIGEGTGLGLSIVHGIVSSHQGRISVDSEPGRGSTFTILLPRAAANDGSLAPAATDNPLSTSHEYSDAAGSATHRASA